MKPMKGHKIAPGKVTYPCIIQPKLNGVHCLASKNSGFYSGDEIDWVEKILGPVEQQFEQLRIPGHMIVTGELYHHGWSLQHINSTVAVKRLDPSPDINYIEFHVFDIAAPGTFVERFSKFVQAVAPQLDKLPNIKIVPSHGCADEQEADELYKYYVGLGYEGIMYRIGDCPYLPGKRVHHLLKRKRLDDDEFDVIGQTEGEGKHLGRLGALICRSASDQPFNVGTGYSDYERQLFHHQPPKRIKVQYRELSDNGIPLEPRFICTME